MAVNSEGAVNITEAEQRRMIEASKETLDSLKKADAAAAGLAAGIVEQSSAQFGGMLEFSLRASEQATKQVARNMDVMMKCGSILTEGWQTIFQEWLLTSRATAQKNMSAFEELMRCRSVDSLLSCQSGILRNGIETLHHGNLRISEVSTKVAGDTVKQISALTCSIGAGLNLTDETGENLRKAGAAMSKIED
ncbi:phasin family protein [Skermanella stibiiresistens]|nr:phasin family protein [Skermanella stibiiresistens]